MELPVDEAIECAEENTTDLFDNILILEDKKLLDSESVDECIYHLNKLATILGLNIDLDKYNDDYLMERE